MSEPKIILEFGARMAVDARVTPNRHGTPLVEIRLIERRDEQPRVFATMRIPVLTVDDLITGLLKLRADLVAELGAGATQRGRAWGTWAPTPTRQGAETTEETAP